MKKKGNKVFIFSDGACSGNPGSGGYGVILRYNGREKELSGGEAHTTNNRMELMGVITGLEALKHPCDVVIQTDSRYVIDGIEKGWAKSWKKRGWVKSDKKPAANSDLWERLLQLNFLKSTRQEEYTALDGDKKALYDLMNNYFVDCEISGHSEFKTWCEDNLENTIQEQMLEKIQAHVDAIADFFFS